MKHIIFIICALSIMSTASAADGWRAKCEVFQSNAETAMNARQAGVAMSEVIGIVEEGGSFESMIIDAYGRPKYTGHAAKQDSIDRFKNEYYLACARASRNQ